MLTQETAARVWQAYREIETAKKLLSDMQEIREREKDRLGRIDKHAPTLKDAFGRLQHLQLGIPSGENGHRLLDVAPELGESVIRAHIAKMEARLTEANEQARLELIPTKEKTISVAAQMDMHGNPGQSQNIGEDCFKDYPECYGQKGVLTFTWGESV